MIVWRVSGNSHDNASGRTVTVCHSAMIYIPHTLSPTIASINVVGFFQLLFTEICISQVNLRTYMYMYANLVFRHY